MALPFKLLGEHFPTDPLLTRTLVSILNRKDILNKRIFHLTKKKAGPRKKKKKPHLRSKTTHEGKKNTSIILLYP